MFTRQSNLFYDVSASSLDWKAISFDESNLSVWVSSANEWIDDVN